MKVGKSATDAAGILGTRVVAALIGNIGGVILARWLEPHDRGLFAIVVLTPSTVVTLVKLGVAQATIYCINRKEATVDEVASNSLILASVLGILAAASVWLLRDSLLHSILGDLPTAALLISLIGVPLALLDNYLQSILQATGQFGLYNRRQLQSETLRLILVAILIIGFHWRITGAAAIYTFITAVNVTWLMISMSRTISFVAGLNLTLLRRMLSFGMRSYVQVVTAHLLLRVDIYMVRAYLSPADTAFYALALRFTETVLEVPQAIGLVLYPKLAALAGARIHVLTAQTCRRTLLATLPASLVLGLIGPWLIRVWYGAAYAPAGAPLPYAAIGVVAMSVFVIITRDFTAREKQRVNTFAGLLALLVNVALNMYLIPHSGIVGASVATAIAYSGAAVILIYFFVLESGLSWRAVLIPRRDDIAYFMTMLRRGFAQLAALR
ncbi:MAG: polysaccharide biosynthesis C-terminal domain-containing protein [bacterium]